MDWKAFTVFSGKDEISKAVQNAQRNTERSSKGMGSAVEGAGRKVDGLKGKFSSLADIAGGVAIGNLIVSGVQNGIAAMKNLVMSVNEYAVRAAAAGKTSQKLGLSAESFQKLSYAAELSCVSNEKITSSFNILNKNLGQFQLSQGNLFKHLSENNRVLYDQVKAARTNEEAFYTIADAISKETDVAKRAALGNAAFGKSWADLVPMINGGSDAIKAAGEQIPNLISDRDIAATTLWNDTWLEIKRNIQGFGDVIRKAVIEYVGPYVLAMKEWINANREMIKQKIAEVVQKAVIVFKRAVAIVQDLIKKVQAVVKFFRDWGRVILVIGGTVGTLWAIVNAVIAIKNAVVAAKAAFAIFNAVVLANPIVLIVTAIVAEVALVIAGFSLLVKKVGGFKEALEVVAQTIMKCLLMPFNLFLDAVQGLMWALGHVPGMGWAKTASDSIGSFQDKINTALTGGTATLLEGGVRGAVEGYRENGIAGAVTGGARGASRVVTESYETHLADYLAAHPEEEPNGSSEEEKWEELLAAFKEGQEKNIHVDPIDVNVDLSDANGKNPKGLRWGAMGEEDYWGTARLGI